jgi:hypothetical protein
MDAENEYNYFDYFVMSENEFYSENPIFVGTNLLSAAAELKQIATATPHDKDGVLEKAGRLLMALWLYCRNNGTITALQPSGQILKTEKQMERQAEDIYLLCTKITNIDILLPYTAFLEVIKADLQNNIYELSREILGISGLNNIHELMASAIEIHCNEEIMYQRYQHITKNREGQKEYEMKSVFPWKYYWNPENLNLMKFLSGCTEITLGRAYTLDEMINKVIHVITHKIESHGETYNVIACDLANYLDATPEQISLSDYRTYQYLLMGSIIPVTFEEAWMDKYPLDNGLPREKFLDIYQPDWSTPVWCKPSLGPVPVRINPRGKRWRTTYQEDPDRI